ncbi:MAG TPA: hypothetical protein VME20_00480 [Acidimicrobiales bacterium]|nr:hypothetical protein [Acidimicrobiales bacterium]
MPSTEGAQAPLAQVSAGTAGGEDGSGIGDDVAGEAGDVVVVVPGGRERPSWSVVPVPAQAGSAVDSIATRGTKAPMAMRPRWRARAGPGTSREAPIVPNA